MDLPLFERLTRPECTLQKPSHKPYDYVQTDDDNSISPNRESRVEAYDERDGGFARNWKGFVPLIDLEAKGIILV